MSLDDFSIHEWEKEKMNKYVELTKLNNAREEGQADGKIDGIRETVINMLKKDTDIKFISEVTNLSIEEIMKIKESL